MLNARDPAFHRVVSSGFTGVAAEKRVKTMHNFDAAELGNDVQVQVVNEQKGPKAKRALTETSLITFASNLARDNAFKKLEAKY